MTELDKVMAKIENKVRHYKSGNLEASEALAGIEDEVKVGNRILQDQKKEEILNGFNKVQSDSE